MHWTEYGKENWTQTLWGTIPWGCVSFPFLLGNPWLMVLGLKTHLDSGCGLPRQSRFQKAHLIFGKYSSDYMPPSCPKWEDGSPMGSLPWGPEPSCESTHTGVHALPPASAVLPSLAACWNNGEPLPTYTNYVRVSGGGARGSLLFPLLGNLREHPCPPPQPHSLAGIASCHIGYWWAFCHLPSEITPATPTTVN